MSEHNLIKRAYELLNEAATSMAVDYERKWPVSGVDVAYVEEACDLLEAVLGDEA